MSRPIALMHRLLLRAGFSFDNPDPRRAWDAFKAFIATPLDGLEPFTIGYDCFHVDDRDDVLWFVLARRFDPDAGLPDCGCVLSRTVPAELRAAGASWWWWPEHGTLDEWIADVEQGQTFQACMRLTGWRWEGFAS